VRFILDHNVDSAVAVVLRREGHKVWTAAQAGLSRVTDDELTVYADEQRAALLTHDVAFSRRRQNSVVGQHVWLRCVDMAAAELVIEHLPEIVEQLERHNDVWLQVSTEGVTLSFNWK
jgi:predicted nuclease of predicted toxin-antitoxin system